jgi:hypothetical protein
MQLCMTWLSVSALLHSEDDDAVCTTVVVVHNHSAHHIGAVDDDVTTVGHCFTCHNLSLRSLTPSASAAAPRVDQHHPRVCPTAIADLTYLDRTPARAPPLAS